MQRQINERTGIFHLQSGEPMQLLDLLRAGADQHHDVLPNLIERGCVYVDGVRSRESRLVAAGAIVRLHTRPKSFACQELGQLRQRIAFESDELVVLDKPSGLPTHPTLDNFYENAKVGLEHEMKQMLYTTHRLDVPTQGLLILAKTQDAQREINFCLARGKMQKWYQARCESVAPLGDYSHYMNPNSRVPKILLEHRLHPSWWHCHLRVESIDGLLHHIQLFTGRTHQIRAQLSYMGHPIVGDEAYGATKLPSPSGLDQIALACVRLRFQFRGKILDLRRERSLEIL